MACFRKRHFLLWLLRALCVLHTAPRGAYATVGLQGVPTWIYLGLKSPFIEFGSQEEQLANSSIPLNMTKDEQANMHQEGLRKLGTFIKPVDLRDSETGFVKADLTKRLVFDSPNNITSRPIHPIQEEMDQKQIILLDEDTDENGLPASLTDEDRKFIVPMALKNISPDPRWVVTTPVPSSSLQTSGKATTTAVPSPMAQIEGDPTSNIDDLKKHILFLHNMTKTNSNFESKFVKFPSLQKDKAKSSAGAVPTSVKRPQRPIHQYSAPIAPPTPKVPDGAYSPGEQPIGGYYQNEELATNQSFLKPSDTASNGVPVSNRGQKTPSEPQVILLNESLATTMPEASLEPINPAINVPKGGPPLRTTKRPPCLRNPESPKCIRQRRREEQQRQRERDEWFRGQSQYMQPRFEPIIQTINNTKRFAVSIEIPDSFKVSSEGLDGGELLSRVARSQPSSRKMMPDYIKVSMENTSVTDYFKHDVVMASADVASERDFLIKNMEEHGAASTNDHNDTAPAADAYSETIDLNPNNCYSAIGLSNSQKKQCVKHTSVMPAISRGARAAIQECQFQFKNRRWNCSTTNDETVFGPMTSLAAPEMAFIHALAAATVTSFIARACRDGQLASCSCSRGTRPKQLHDDWKWGGCGDNLEFAYKFATDFIDSREKETNRETRGVKRKRDEIGKNRMHSDDTNAFNIGIKRNRNDDAKNDTTLVVRNVRKSTEAESSHLLNENFDQHLSELEQRITKEILTSKIDEEEMIKLQEKIKQEIVNTKFKAEQPRKKKRKNQRAAADAPAFPRNGIRDNYKDGILPRSSATAKARSLMNLHNNEAGRRAVIKKARITCKCHGVSGSCSLITCWQQLSSIREIGDYLREKYEGATKVKINKRGRLQIKDLQFKVPTAHDLIYLDESPDWCRNSHMLHWPGTHGRVCHKNSSGLESCAILCCGRGYNTKNIIVNERCNCKFHWCCQVKCEVCTKVLEEHTCK
ncbi:protein Wnt-5 [Drosophila subpulchrella]|uniref:protein Wnt-5 n=1 Tax=Drosophila subpulchrella TaxID=1486046 RepID=UPI0018A15E83|nr:protein Wnt-5 [Drosophila subpulchrella]